MLNKFKANTNLNSYGVCIKHWHNGQKLTNINRKGFHLGKQLFSMHCYSYISIQKCKLFNIFYNASSTETVSLSTIVQSTSNFVIIEAMRVFRICSFSRQTSSRCCEVQPWLYDACSLGCAAQIQLGALFTCKLSPFRLARARTKLVGRLTVAVSWLPASEFYELC